MPVDSPLAAAQAALVESLRVGALPWETGDTRPAAAIAATLARKRMKAMMHLHPALRVRLTGDGWAAFAAFARVVPLREGSTPVDDAIAYLQWARATGVAPTGAAGLLWRLRWWRLQGTITRIVPSALFIRKTRPSAPEPKRRSAREAGVLP
jgi:hypothetical protein